jgi:hypothetical protein
MRDVRARPRADLLPAIEGRLPPKFQMDTVPSSLPVNRYLRGGGGG